MKPSTRRVLAVLESRAGQWVPGRDLAEVGGFRFGGRIFELRHEHGLNIERRSSKRSAVDEYRLLAEAEQMAMAL